jgi:dTDP-4-dehydrorhamnose 3,5-epimerase
MRVRETKLAGVLILDPEQNKDFFLDDRGEFQIAYDREAYGRMGADADFYRDHRSISKMGALRGLHYQLRHPQAKLCTVLAGEAIDVVADVRVGSPTFGESITVHLRDDNRRQVYIPRGFAHGFVSLRDHTIFEYKVDAPYDPNGDCGIHWDDPDLGIHWPLTRELLVNKRDKELPTLRKARQAGWLPEYKQ